MRNIFTAANNCIGVGQRSKFRPKFERFCQPTREGKRPFPIRKKLARRDDISGCSVTRDLPLDKGKLEPANARQFSARVNVWHGCKLRAIDRHKSMRRLAAKRESQLDIGNQAESTREIIAFNRPAFHSIGHHNRFETVLPQGLHWPATVLLANAAERVFKINRLYNFRWRAPEIRGKPSDT